MRGNGKKRWYVMLDRVRKVSTVQPMVLHLSAIDGRGGAARAAYRIHEALSQGSVESRMLVARKDTTDQSVESVYEPSELWRYWRRARIDLLPLARRRKYRGVTRSLNWLNNKRTFSRCIELKPDLINLHWIGSGFISIKEIARLPCPLIWTIHDMWSFSGIMHYENQSQTVVAEKSCSENEFGRVTNPLIDRIIRKLKIYLWRQRSWNVIAPSSWIAKKARSSIVFRNANIRVIPYPLDLSVFRPLDQIVSRKALEIPQHKFVICFAADTGIKDPRKGFDLFMKILWEIPPRVRSTIECVILGCEGPPSDVSLPVATTWVGKSDDNQKIAACYSTADVTLLTSRIDNLPQVGTEAQACGCPVIAYDVGGLADVVEHGATGFLVPAFDAVSVAHYVQTFVNDPNKLATFGWRARERAEQIWSYEAVATQYADFCREVLGTQQQ